MWNGQGYHVTLFVFQWAGKKTLRELQQHCHICIHTTHLRISHEFRIFSILTQE